jgi:Na+-translocating ferredoxin:NAD+ oxidoreductase RnfG subunit
MVCLANAEEMIIGRRAVAMVVIAIIAVALVYLVYLGVLKVVEERKRQPKKGNAK